jgi:hypothetical protein
VHDVGVHSRYGFLQVEFYRARAVAGFGAGVVSAVAAAGATWAYLSSIKLDDGLEVLIFFPILTVAVALANGITVWGAERETTVNATLSVGSGALFGSCAVTVAIAPGAVLVVLLFGSQWVVAGCFSGWGISAAIRASAPWWGHLRCRGRVES